MLSEGVTTVGAWQFAGLLCGGMLVMLEVGRRIGIRQRARLGDAHGAGLAAVEGSLFALLGLIVAFTFSGAAARFDQRRALIVEEANDIGTAYLRLDLLPADAQPALRQKFRQYADARIEAYRVLPNLKLAMDHLERANALQGEIWKLSVSGTQSAPTTAPSVLLLPAVNAMIDITNTRFWSAQTHPPGVIFALAVGAYALLCLVRRLRHVEPPPGATGFTGSGFRSSSPPRCSSSWTSSIRASASSASMPSIRPSWTRVRP